MSVEFLSGRSIALDDGLRLAGRDQAEAVRADDARALLRGELDHLRDLAARNALGDDHDEPDAFSGQNYFPDEFKKRPKYYDPPERGFEREIKKRLDYWSKLRSERNRRS